METADVVNTPGNDIFTEEVEWDILVPRSADLLVHLQGLVTVLDQREVVVSVIDKMIVGRRGADRDRRFARRWPPAGPT